MRTFLQYVSPKYCAMLPSRTVVLARIDGSLSTWRGSSKAAAAAARLQPLEITSKRSAIQNNVTARLAHTCPKAAQ
jgi:hypothetical protein